MNTANENNISSQTLNTKEDNDRESASIAMFSKQTMNVAEFTIDVCSFSGAVSWKKNSVEGLLFYATPHHDDTDGISLGFFDEHDEDSDELGVLSWSYDFDASREENLLSYVFATVQKAREFFKISRGEKRAVVARAFASEKLENAQIALKSVLAAVESQRSRFDETAKSYSETPSAHNFAKLNARMLSLQSAKQTERDAKALVRELSR